MPGLWEWVQEGEVLLNDLKLRASKDTTPRVNPNDLLAEAKVHVHVLMSQPLKYDVFIT